MILLEPCHFADASTVTASYAEKLEMTTIRVEDTPRTVQYATTPNSVDIFAHPTSNDDFDSTASTPLATLVTTLIDNSEVQIHLIWDPDFHSGSQRSDIGAPSPSESLPLRWRLYLLGRNVVHVRNIVINIADFPIFWHSDVPHFLLTAFDEVDVTRLDLYGHQFPSFGNFIEFCRSLSSLSELRITKSSWIKGFSAASKKAPPNPFLKRMDLKAYKTVRTSIGST